MDLSVVVPSVNGIPIVLECLEALRADAAHSRLQIETIVVDRCGESVRHVIRDRFPEATVVAAESGTTIPAMRAVAFGRASAPVVAVIEDHVIVPPGWGRDMVEALAQGAAVVGGGVQNAAVATRVDRAAFLCEYSHMLPPQPAGPVRAVTGNNVVYRRDLLDRYRMLIESGRWENELHTAMRRDGVRLVGRPDIVVGHKMHYRMRDYMAQRFWYARAYAGMRRTSLSSFGKVAWAVGSLALPPVLLARIVGRVRRSDPPRPALVSLMPLLVLFVCAWALGEMVGYAAGGGDALSRVA
jgi:hypothetical protein